MSWLKKTFNKLFKDDEYETYDEQYEYEDDYEEEESITKKSEFRFPLIGDEEINSPSRGQEKVSRVQQSALPPEERPLELPRHLQDTSSQVYDVETQGIRDLLAKRRQRTGHSYVLPRTKVERRQLTVTKEEQQFLKKEPVREEKKVNREYINPLENKKRFVPTEVPSPVHGFQKSKPIEELLETKRQTAEQPQGNEAPVIEEADPVIEVAPVEETTTIKVISQEKVVELPKIKEPQPTDFMIEAVEESKPVDIDPLQYAPNDALILLDDQAAEEAEATSIEMSTESTIDEEETNGHPADVAEALSDVQVKHLTIENSTIHIGQLNVEQAQQNEFVQVKEQVATVSEPAPQKSVEEPKPSGSRLPFNVLMLKSDKQKIMAKDMLHEQLKKSKKRQETTTENQEPETNLNVEGPVEEIEVSSTQVQATTETSSPTIVIPSVTLQQEPQQASIAVLEREEEVARDEPKATIEPEQEVENDEAPIEEPIVQQEPLQEMLMEEPIEQDVTTVEVTHKSEIIEPAPVVTKPATPIEEPKFSRQYEKPSMGFLVPPEEKTEDWAWMDEQGERLIKSLSYFHIDAEIVSIVQGPAVTQFEITVAHGTKVSKVRGLADDIKLALAARDIRIDAPIPGKHSIGIEIPNRVSRAVRLSEVTNSEDFQDSDSPLEAALGLDLTGTPVTIDLRQMPHGLIAGATGSGKSVCINSILVSLLYKADPHELKLMLIDPKMVELAPFNHIPHLLSPVITDVKAATAALKWAVEEMERRYQLFMHAGVRDLTRFNQQADKSGQHGHKLPYILIVIDELADLMMMSPADVEEAICRIAQKARACGIHLIVATQRPSVDVVTGLIKSNIPTRIAFAVSSAVDSRTILDMQGAERLLGRGDMLYLGNGMPAPVRLQGTFVTDDEIEEIISYVRSQGEPEYFFQHDELLKKAEIVDEQDELFEEVCRYVFEAGTASTSSIQRRYKIGYNRAARLIDMLEKHGYVSEQRGSKPREVFITESDIISMFE